jgi:O-antigen/teichoic acid export membrane protein
MLDAQDKSAWQELYHQIGRWTLALALPCYLFLLLRAELCLRVLGVEFAPAAAFMTALCLGPMLGAALGPAESLLNMAGHSRWQLGNSMVALAVNLVAGVLFLPRGGADAMAWIISGTSLLYVLLMAAESIFLFRFLPVSASQLRVLLAAAPALCFLILVRHFPFTTEPWLELPLESLLYAVLYVGALYLLNVNAQDRDILTQMFRRIRDHLLQSRHPDQPSKYL